MILADENIDYRIIESIKSVGIDVQSVYDNARGISDEQVIELAQNPPRIILTEDKDFGEWVFAHKVEEISVVFLRYRFDETSKMIDILKNLLQYRLEDLMGHFTTITTKKIRRRKI